MNLYQVYPLFPIQPVHAEGCYITDAKGRKYLDFYGGHAVISIGHNHPHYVDRLTAQLNKLAFYSNSVINPLQEKLAALLGTLSHYPNHQLFLVNSGAEAVENALKLASFTNGRTGVIAFERSFHGRTSGAVAATDNPKLCAPINFRDHVTILPMEDSDAVEQVMKQGTTSAVIIEGIQGIGGIHVPSPEFLRALRQLCDRYGALLIIDEIQSGYGRSGAFFAHQHSGVQADLIPIAKGMGNGFPIGGVLIHPDIRGTNGQLGTTFGGNHLACSAALAVLEVIRDQDLIENAGNMGKELQKQLAGISHLREVRGTGLMLGLQFEFPVQKLRNHLLLEEAIFVGSASDPQVLRLLPPLTAGEAEVDLLMHGLKNALKHEELLVH